MTKAADRMIKSAQQALAFASATADHGCNLRLPDVIDPKRIRERLELSQDAFAQLFGCKKRTLEAWEQGRRMCGFRNPFNSDCT
ncbi:MAG: transcriptional regulator [Pseudomonadota bacterium]